MLQHPSQMLVFLLEVVAHVLGLISGVINEELVQSSQVKLQWQSNS